jgi:hypothetical protein
MYDVILQSLNQTRYKNRQPESISRIQWDAEKHLARTLLLFILITSVLGFKFCMILDATSIRGGPKKNHSNLFNTCTWFSTFVAKEGLGVTAGGKGNDLEVILCQMQIMALGMTNQARYG